MKKKNIILLIIAIVLLVLVGTTMAYFGWSSSAENKDQLVDVTVTSGTGSCDKYQDNEKILVPTSTRENGRIIKVKAKQQMTTNAFITWNLVINSINESTLTTSGLKHNSFKYELVNDTTGVSYGTGNFENVTEGTTITFSTNKETLDYNKEYMFILYLWIDGTMGTNPLDMASQPYNFDLNCSITGTDNKITPEVPTNLVTHIKYLYNNAEKTTVTNNSITYNTAPSAGLMNDRLGGTTADLDGGNIRYYGAEPNNYIYFNCSDYSNQNDNTCEKWRIIGVFDNKVKIIRNESIGNFSWDNKTKTTGAETDYGKNDWTDARLMKLLNPGYESETIGGSLYYNSKSGMCYSGKKNATISCDFTSKGIKNDTTRNMIAKVIWNLGGLDIEPSEIYSDQIYSYERGKDVYEGGQTSWDGKIALMYPSDYGYAVNFNFCSQVFWEYNNAGCTENNWLFNSTRQYTLTPYSSASTSVFGIAADGKLGNMAQYLNATYSRPVLYLNSNVNIVSMSDTGTNSNPYRISV